MADIAAHFGRALVLDAHSSAGIEVVQSLGRAGIEVDMATEHRHCLASASRYTRRRTLQPDASNSSSFLSWLRELDNQRRYSLIVASTENSLIAINCLPEGDTLRDKALLPSRQALQIALSKDATWHRAKHLGLPVPQSRLVTATSRFSDTLAYPVVLKPLHSLVSVAGNTEGLVPVVARNEQERNVALDRLLPKTPVQEQAYVGGRGLGVECLYDHGRLLWVFVHERIHELPLTGGGSTYRKSVSPHTPAVEYARRILDDLHWHGIAMVEFKLSPNGDVCLIEINPRLWGSLALAIDANVNFPIGMWHLARGESPGPQPKYRVPYFTRNLTRDLYWLKDNWLADHNDPLQLTRPRFRSLAEYLRPLLFVESWDHFDVHDLRVTYAQLRRLLGDVVERAIVRPASSFLVRRRMRTQHAQVVRDIRAGNMVVKRILFVCYGNICRSPYAELYARSSGLPATAASAGFYAVPGRASPPHLIRAASASGVDLDGWRSQVIDAGIVAKADLILTMDAQNFRMLEQHFPESRLRAVPLSLFATPDTCEIDDPYALSEEHTTDILSRIAMAIDGLAQLLRSVEQPTRH